MTAELLVLSHYQVTPILRARAEGKREVSTSLDLGRSSSGVVLEATRVVLPGGESLTWESLDQVARGERACFVVDGGGVTRIERFSEFASRYYSLMPTERAPTLLVSGIPMHRVKGTTPDRDTRFKLRTIAPIAGRVLDTCTGLGYTAIGAAETAEEVVTIEFDPAVLEVARLNPWSRQLFSDLPIRQIVGDAYEEVAAFNDGAFSRIIHDPPMFSLAGELYSGVFYAQLFRVLKPKGRLFHYVGDLESRSGRNVARGVVRRLKEAGFTRVTRRPEAFGLVAYR